MTTAPYRAMAGDSEPEVVARGETFSLLPVYAFFNLFLLSFGLCDLCYPKNSVIFHGQFARFYQWVLYQELDSQTCIHRI